jgi:hypothetical protein
MAKDLNYCASIPSQEATPPTAEYWGPKAAQGYETTWGLKDEDRHLCGLIRRWAELELRTGVMPEEVSLLNATNRELVTQIEGLRTLVEKLGTELESSEGQVASLRMQVGKARKKIERLEVSDGD